MLVYNATGNTTSGELRISKPISSLLVRSDLPFNSLENETISIFIEKANENFDLAVKMNLADFILLNTYGEAAIYTKGDDLTNAICELSNYGAIHLNENESIKIVLENLDATKTYKINGIEDAETSEIVNVYERKVVLSEETTRKFSVENMDMVAISNLSSINDIVFTFANGATAKKTGEEIEALSIDIDPFQYCDTAGAIKVTGLHSTIMPLTGVIGLEINKPTGTAIPLHFKKEKVNA